MYIGRDRSNRVENIMLYYDSLLFSLNLLQEECSAPCPVCTDSVRMTSVSVARALKEDTAKDVRNDNVRAKDVRNDNVRAKDCVMITLERKTT